MEFSRMRKIVATGIAGAALSAGLSSCAEEKPLVQEAVSPPPICSRIPSGEIRSYHADVPQIVFNSRDFNILLKDVVISPNGTSAPVWAVEWDETMKKSHEVPCGMLASDVLDFVMGNADELTECAYSDDGTSAAVSYGQADFGAGPVPSISIFEAADGNLQNADSKVVVGLNGMSSTSENAIVSVGTICR